MKWPSSDALCMYMLKQAGRLAGWHIHRPEYKSTRHDRREADNVCKDNIIASLLL